MTNSTDQPVETRVSEPAEELQWLSHRQVLTILSGLLLGIFLAALDQNIVSVAIVKIANSLHGFDQQAWATTAYLITATISTPLYGKLADIYGRKPFYLIAIAVFVIGSAACTFATSMYELAGFRAFQGLGAGGLMSLALTIIGDVVPPRERVRYQGYFMIAFGSATVLGPVLGGLLSDYEQLGGIDGWRWIFLVNVPVGIIALLVVAKVLNVPHKRHSHRIDWFGAVALTTCVVPLLIVAEQGRSWGWGSTAAVICYAIAAFGLVFFLFVEYVMKDAALIPLRLFKNSTFSVSIAGSAIVGVAMFGGLTMVPQYFQVVRGFSPTKAGLLMLPLMIGLMVSSQICGRITKSTGRYKILPVVGTFVIAVGAALFAQIHYDSALWQPMVYELVIGFGLGSCMQTLIIAAQNAGPRADMGVSTAAATFFRQIGGTLGVAVFLTVLFNLLPHKIIDAFGGSLPEGFDADQLSHLQSNTSGLADMPAALEVPILTGFTDSMRGVFYVAAGVALLACVVLMFMKEIPLQGDPTRTAPKDAGDPSSNAADPSPIAAESVVAAAERSTEPERELLAAGRHALASANGHADNEVAAKRLPMVSVMTGAGDFGSGEVVDGRVRRQDGRGVVGAVVTLVDNGGRQVGRGVCGPDGGFVVGGVNGAGSYVLIVSAEGYRPQAVGVGVGSGVVDVVLVGSGELGGVVRSMGGVGVVVGGVVTLADARGEVVGSVVSGDDGGFAFGGVDVGVYTLVASAVGMCPVAVVVTMPESGVLVRDVELVSAVVLVGSVCAAGGRAVEDALVSVQDESGVVVAVTRSDESGQYVVAGLPIGEYRVTVSGYPAVTGRVVLSSGKVAHAVVLGHEPADSGSAEQADHA